MAIPGMNLMKIAQRAIKLDPVIYYRFLGVTVNPSMKYQISNYSLGINVKGSFQLLSRDKYEQYGLNFNKKYTLFYAYFDKLQDVNRDISGDVFEYAGEYYQVESLNADFYLQDGWVSGFSIKIDNFIPPVPLDK